jgi:AraC family transcriptional regulator of arabinose operon
LGLPAYLIRLQTEGASDVFTDDREIRMEAGDLLILPPGATYELRIGDHATGRSNVVSTVISGDFYLFCLGAWVELWWKRIGEPNLVRLAVHDTLLSLWRHLIVEKCRVKEDNQELLSFLLGALCLCLERAAMGNVNPDSSRPYAATRMRQYIVENAYLNFKVEDVARHVGMSVSRATHYFKQYYGLTIMQYLANVRLDRAVDRMKYTTQTLEQIAADCGFGSYTHFFNTFKEKFGLSPTDFRHREAELF